MRIKALAQLIMIEQSLFSLPWAIAATVLAWPKSPDNFTETTLRVVMVIVAVILARTAGMSLNRWIDRDIDSVNPRTSNRPLQMGLVQLNHVIGLSLACLALLVLIAASLGLIFLILSPIVLGLLAVYSYTKRFTWFCHFVLGIIHGSAPLLAYLAVAGQLDLTAIYLGFACGSAIVAADILYALQDIQHDRQVGLYSIPAAFGFDVAQKISIVMYALSAASLAAMGAQESFGYAFWVVWLVFTILPISMHSYLREGRIYEGFYRCTAILPILALLAVIVGCWRVI